MSAGAFDPGDVRLATVNGERMLVLRGRGIFEGNWYTQGPVAGSRLAVTDSWLLDERPLVVIDPVAITGPDETGDDGDPLTEIANCLRRLAEGDHESSYRRRVAERLAEVFDPTPPKPEEPTGLGAVVEDADGVQYVLVTGDDEFPWAKTPAGDWQIERLAWDEFTAVRVLSEGVTA